jgi:hypothetical protein
LTAADTLPMDATFALEQRGFAVIQGLVPADCMSQLTSAYAAAEASATGTSITSSVFRFFGLTSSARRPCAQRPNSDLGELTCSRKPTRETRLKSTSGDFNCRTLSIHWTSTGPMDTNALHASTVITSPS